MFVYDSLVNNVPTQNVPNLIKQFGKRAGITINHVPHRNTVELICREIGVISDIMSAELLVTSKDKCYVLAVDELPGGTTEDYSMHLNDTLDSLWYLLSTVQY